jgi:hypothetical protein
MGFTIASCIAYITKNGVMIPGVSAGSNHVGASVMCTPHVIWPSGAAPAGAGFEPAIAKSIATTLIVCLSRIMDGTSVVESRGVERDQPAGTAMPDTLPTGAPPSSDGIEA